MKAHHRVRAGRDVSGCFRRALGDPRLFAIGLADDDPSCLVEQAVNAAVADTLSAAEALVIARFGEVTLADIARDFDARFAAVVKGREA